MSGVAIMVGWDGPQAPEDQVRRMLERIPHRATEGCSVLTDGSCALGFARHGTMARERAETQPLHDARHGISVVADVRLDNRAELNAVLRDGRQPIPADAELLLLGYLRWGTELASHLAGDFAFAIWDAGPQRLYAARDPFGVRTLYYHTTPSRLAVASEVEQLLALEGKKEVEDAVVLDFLTGEYRHRRETFFRGICRVLPGHWLLATQGTLREVRYWRPAGAPLRWADPRQYVEEFRDLFRQAVAARLDADRPLVAHLSGGLDSSSIVCMAADLYQRNGVDRQPLYLASALYPGLDCDETPFINQVARRVHFPLERWNGTSAEVSAPTRLLLAHPWGSAAFGGSWGDFHIAGRRGARVILSGFGGDEVLFERGVFRDLAAHGQWLTLLRETLLAPLYSTMPRRFFLEDAVRGALPASIRRLYRWFRPRRQETPPPPPWLGDRLRMVWEGSLAPPEEPDAEPSSSHTRRATWEWLTHPRTWWLTEIQVLDAARYGLQFRYPFLDARLAGFVLAVPFEQRLPGGRMKLLLRKALKDLLPPKVARRREVTTFDSNALFLFRQCLPHVTAILEDGKTWLSAPFVRYEAARELIESLDSESPNTVNWGKIGILDKVRTLWDVVTLELWLRLVSEAFSNPVGRT